jgi:branched-chain amino acid transport system permease protein
VGPPSLLAFDAYQPLVLGVSSGAAIGLVAVGLVLVYKSTSAFNFAAGEFVTLGAFGVYAGSEGWHLPFPLAIACGLAVGALAGLVTEVLVVRPLANRPPVTILVATAVLTTVAIALELIQGGTRFFPARPVVRGIGFKIPGAEVYVSWQQLLIVCVLIAIGIALAWFFNRTDLGLAVLATSQEPTASRLVGIRPHRISMLVWGLAGLLGGMAGVLLAPVNAQFQAGYGTTSVLIAAFTAAVVGGMTSIPGAFIGGVLVGTVQAFAQLNVSSDDLPGANSVATLLLLVAVLLVRPRGLLGREA